MHRRDRRLVGGVRVLLHANRLDPDQIGKSNELVRETGVAVLSIRLSNDVCVDDRIPVCRIEAEEGK